MAAPQLRRKRSIIYVDGFNLYYGALQHGPYKWLNLERYFRLLRPNDCIQQIRYFTARISGSHAANQETYLLALETLPLLKVVFGRFKSKQLQCLVPSCPLPSPPFFSTYEEKRTDVNIAFWMLHDALKDLCDRLVLVSGDSDLVPAVSMVKQHHPNKEVIVYIPARSAIREAAVELRSAADKNKTLPLSFLKACQFPAEIKTSAGVPIRKPSGW